MKRTTIIEETKKRGITFTSLAQSTRISKEMISHIINGRHNPSWETQQRLVNFFGISSELLFRPRFDEQMDSVYQKTKEMKTNAKFKRDCNKETN